MIITKLSFHICDDVNVKKKIDVCIKFYNKLGITIKIKLENFVVYKEQYSNLIYENNYFYSNLIEIKETYILFKNKFEFDKKFDEKYISELFNDNDRKLLFKGKIVLPYKIIGEFHYNTTPENYTLEEELFTTDMKFIYIQNKKIKIFYNCECDNSSFKIIEPKSDKILYNFFNNMYELNISKYADKIVSENICNYTSRINKIIESSILYIGNIKKIDNINDEVKKIKWNKILEFDINGLFSGKFDVINNIYNCLMFDGNNDKKHLLDLMDENTYNKYKSFNFDRNIKLDSEFNYYLMGINLLVTRICLYIEYNSNINFSK
jgi:hypothetical protein